MTEYVPLNEEKSSVVEVPSSALSDEALVGIIDNFILREGTDYGTQESTYESKVNRVKKQIEDKDVVIVFDPNTESVSLLTSLEFGKLTRAL